MAIHGWLGLDKACGGSSAQAVAEVRRITGAARAGHGGTLDPMASGVLPVALGEATKTLPFLVPQEKSYQAEISWGEERDTDDAMGRVTATSSRRPSREEISASLGDFCGLVSQVPPAHAAVRTGGRRAYEIARAGGTPALSPRLVCIREIRLLDNSQDRAWLRILCGKGVYVRAIARDLGRKLGCLGHVSALRRLSSGPFTLETSLTIGELKNLWNADDWSIVLRPVETVLADVPVLVLAGDALRRARCGGVLDLSRMRAGEAVLRLPEPDGGDVPVRELAPEEVRRVTGARGSSPGGLLRLADGERLVAIAGVDGSLLRIRRGFSL